jgi:hypothetical protein
MNIRPANIHDMMKEVTTMAHITKYHYSHLLTGRKPGEAIHVGPSIEGTRWRSWMGHYATSRKVTGPIPDEVIAFFN